MHRDRTTGLRGPALRAAGLAGAAVLTCAGLAGCGAPADIPAPQAATPKAVRAWFERHIEAKDWTVLEMSEDAITLGSPEGVRTLPDGSLRAQIRREYYAPVDMEGMQSRSNLQVWNVDCAARRWRIVNMQIFALSNLKGEHRERDHPDAAWTPASSDTARRAMLDRICSAANGRALA